MQNVRNKQLNNQRGATVLIALLVLLVCVLVATLVVSAASASVGRINNRVRNEQLFEAAESAAEIIADNYNGMKFAAYCVDGTFNDWVKEENVKTYIAGQYLHNSVALLLSNETAIQRILPGIEHVSVNFYDAESTNDKTLEYYGAGAGSIMVSATVQMKEDFSIECIVTSSYKDSDSDKYTVSFVIPASVTENSSFDETQITNRGKYVKVITWGTPQMAKKDN